MVRQVLVTLAQVAVEEAKCENDLRFEMPFENDIITTDMQLSLRGKIRRKGKTMVIRVSLIGENAVWRRTETVDVPSAVNDNDHILAVVKDTAKKIALNLFPHGMGESFDGIEWKDNEVTLKLHCCGKRIIEKSNQDGQMVIEENQSVPDREFEISARW